MEFVVLPIEDAQEINLKNLDTRLKSLDGSKVLIHIEDLVENYRERGMMLLTTSETGEETEQMPDIPYPVYRYESKELTDLLNSSEWKPKNFM